MNTDEQNDYTASLSVAHDRKDLAWRDRRRWYRRTCALGTEAVGDHVTHQIGEKRAESQKQAGVMFLSGA